MATRRLQFPEEIRSADEKDAKTFHGDGLPKAFAKNVVHAALDVLERLDKNITSVVNERMRKVLQKGSLTPGNRRQLEGTPEPAPPALTTCEGAFSKFMSLERCRRTCMYARHMLCVER
jgi:hypothetical protein